MEEKIAQQFAENTLTEIKDIQLSIQGTINSVSGYAITIPIRGKLIDEWKKIFYIGIEQEADPIHIKTALRKVMYNRQTAQQFLQLSKLERRLYSSFYDKKTNSFIAIESQKLGKRSSLEKIEKQAEAILGDKTLIKKYLDWEIDFWQDLILVCNDTYKVLNTMAISNGTLYKIGEPH